MANQPLRRQQRESSPQGRSPKPQQNPIRLTLQVGEKWPDGIEITELETVPACEGLLKTGVIIAIIVLCSFLIAVLTVHAMAIGHQQRLDRVLDTAWKVLGGFSVWAVVQRVVRTLRE
ncbi:MAG TPA: hypothetical protein VN442_11775 [Bryobacteraceae bacterium]|nr:hypothetical protein [Bryobacteraceae bacterium]